MGGNPMVARPVEWKGSDLRSRTEVVRYLAERGGEVVDKSGLVVGKMREQLGRGRALTQLLADMESDGMIEREVRGRRTFRVTLLDDWKLVPRAVPPAPADGHPIPDGVDYDQLAEALLAITLKRATTPIPVPEVDGQLASRIKRAEANLNEAKGQIRDLKAELKHVEGEKGGLTEMVRRLEHNQEVLQSQLTRAPTDKRNQGVSIYDRLSDDERSMLSSLMTALPETPQSKPRGTRKQRTR